MIRNLRTVLPALLVPFFEEVVLEPLDAFHVSKKSVRDGLRFRDSLANGIVNPVLAECRLRAFLPTFIQVTYNVLQSASA